MFPISIWNPVACFECRITPTAAVLKGPLFYTQPLPVVYLLQDDVWKRPWQVSVNKRGAGHFDKAPVLWSSTERGRALARGRKTSSSPVKTSSSMDRPGLLPHRATSSQINKVEQRIFAPAGLRLWDLFLYVQQWHLINYVFKLLCWLIVWEFVKRCFQTDRLVGSGTEWVKARHLTKLQDCALPHLSLIWLASGVAVRS